jgi:prepilin peptidase CpaA
MRSRRIPNLWTGSCLLTGLVLHLWLNGLHGCGAAALAAVLAGSGFLLLYAAGGMGAGDVKLMAAVGCLGGLAGLKLLLLATVLAGGAFALVLAACHGQLWRTIGRALRICVDRDHGESLSTRESLTMPFAVPVAVGSLCSLFVQLSR